jgi:PAS domain S-box-containing protein
VLVLVLLSAFRICALSLPDIRVFLHRYTDIPLALTLVNLLFFWLLATLWVAFREWKNAAFREQELQRVIASVSPDVLMVVSPERIITACNNAVKHIFGFEAEEVIGRRTDLLYSDRRVSSEDGEIYNLLQKVGFHVGYATGHNKHGGTVPIEIVTGNLKGRPGAVVLVRDVSRRDAVERELMEARERADRAEKEKEEALRMLEQNSVKMRKLELMKGQLAVQSPESRE